MQGGPSGPSGYFRRLALGFFAFALVLVLVLIVSVLAFDPAFTAFVFPRARG